MPEGADVFITLSVAYVGAGAVATDVVFFCVEVSAQQPLDLTVEHTEGVVMIHSIEHIVLRIAGALSCHDGRFLPLRPKAKLPQSGRCAA